MENKYKKTASLYFIAAICFLLVGILGIIRDANMPYMYIGLGAAFLCFGSVNLTKAKRENNGNDKDEN